MYDYQFENIHVKSVVPIETFSNSDGDDELLRYYSSPKRDLTKKINEFIFQKLLLRQGGHAIMGKLILESLAQNFNLGHPSLCGWNRENIKHTPLLDIYNFLLSKKSLKTVS